MVDIGRVGIIGGGGWLGHAIAKALIGSSAVSAERLTCSFRSRKRDNAGASPSETVKTFVDYKGTTAIGIIAMRQMGFDRAVSAGLEAASRKGSDPVKRVNSRRIC